MLVNSTGKRDVLGTSVPWLVFAISSITRGLTAVFVRAFGESLAERGHSGKHLKETEERALGKELQVWKFLVP